MISIETLATFFGWCTVINLAFIVLAFLFFGAFHEFAGGVQSKIFGTTREEAKASFSHVFLQYRIAFVVFNLAPYIALKIMS
ncbi:MAG: hypothetical protein OEQ28_06320 [Acidobacteriota bacterium]|nr:hypothetical protein [Acidobacteriota bacterium]